ncbi:MAG: hypothetical protein AAGH71_01230 [Planctomycetota bacterium]
MLETSLADLWLPILAVTIATMVLSTLAWTALPHHKPDMRELPDADAFAEHIEKLTHEPGQYYFPSYGTANEPSPRIKTGPWGNIKIYAAAPSMGKNIALTFISLAVIAVFVGYVAALTCPPGDEWLHIFQVATTSAMLCHVFGGTLHGIWFGKRLRFFITDAIDGVAYSLATGAILASMWPAAAAATPAG